MLKSSWKKDGRSTKYTYTIKTCYGRCNAYNFASSFMTFPAMIIQLFAPNIQEQTGFWSVIYKFSIATSTSANIPVGYTIANAIVYLLLILGFTFSTHMLHLIQLRFQTILREMEDLFQE